MGLLLLATIFSHLFVDPVSLDGVWEVGYSPWEYSWQLRAEPQFHGETATNAVPGYWEDLFPVVGRRLHPLYREQHLPIVDTAADMTLANLYGACFYRRQFTLEHAGAAILRFGGVRNQVHVWINGQFVAFHQGFSTPFELPVELGILHPGENTIVLAVSNNPNLGYASEVCGLTTRSTFGGTGGIEGYLELAFLKNDLGDVYVTTAPDLKHFTIHVSGNTEYEWEIANFGKGRHNGELTLPCDGLALWSPESPRLHELVIRTKGGERSVKFGLRRLTTEGEKLKLNGRFVYLRGVTEHCYFPTTVHLPRDLKYYRMITAKRKELGFNFVRFHTFVPPVEYLEACDELGMLVHIESPNFADFSDYERIIAFARSHPSVVIYCTGNEYRIDRLTETYLERIAEMVHTETDALFSPMSALRGLEYQLMPGKDVIVNDPFPHNPERFARVGRYADLYTSYQNGASSYTALNSPYSAKDVDCWGDVYRKPRLAHEICIDGTYVDLSTEALYPKDSPILKTGIFREIRAQLTKKGILDCADLYYRNSCEWQRRCRKFCFEKVRSMRRTQGYDFLGDINTHWHTFGYSVGMMDEFYRLKPSESVENVRRYNSAAVLLCDLGSDFNFGAGTKREIGFSISNYAREALNAALEVCLVDECGNEVFKRKIENLAAPLGEVTDLHRVEVEFPASSVPRKYFLRASFSTADLLVANEWETYAFPAPHSIPADQNLTVVTQIGKSDLLTLMNEGKSVLLFGATPFRSSPSTFQIGLAGRTSGNLATVIAKHPALGDFPHEGFCGWQFRRMMEGAATIELGSAASFDPIIDVASSVKNPLRQAFLFEYRVGKGRLLVCSFKFSDNDPASLYLKAQLIAYASSSRFAPKFKLSELELLAIIDASQSAMSADTNRANNLNDPSSEVRSGPHAQP